SDADEAKTQENAKLQSALEEMLLQFKETKAMLTIKVVSLAKKLQPSVTIVEVLLFVGRVAKRLLLRRECCTFSNGEYVKARLVELELWCVQVKEEYAGSSWDELKHIRQAVGFLLEALPAIRGTDQLGSNLKVFPINFLNNDKRLR
ncbi:hypothetical protein GIB67_024454, partial [Kingdonia uniflora]